MPTLLVLLLLLVSLLHSPTPTLAASSATLPGSSPQPQTRVCLNMIVKNEADGIEDFVDHFARHVSGWVVCDTGSTDDTPQLVQTAFEAHGVPGQLVRHLWVDFGTNRDKCLHAMVDWSRERGGLCEYYLFTDADQVGCRLSSWGWEVGLGA